MDVIYRIVGTATRWMARLAPGQVVSAMGPLGNSFPLSPTKQHAWMVAGGVGLPPMLWLAERLRGAGKEPVAFVGARRAALLPLAIENPGGVARDGRSASLSAAEFSLWDTPVVISTDDGSLGCQGHIPDTMKEFARANDVAHDDLVVYTCGPEPMMQAVACFCVKHSIECYTCLERAMACGTGTCQSCAVAVRDAKYDDGWRYALCCTEGPVFDARRVIWTDNPTQVAG
jgi:dihydroorotate dehydrogenase electron transfer subunit